MINICPWVHIPAYCTIFYINQKKKKKTFKSNQTAGLIKKKEILKINCIEIRENICTIYFLVHEAIYSDKGSVNTVRWQTVARFPTVELF